MDVGIASVAGITVISYLVAAVVKATQLDKKWLPVICGGTGAILGVAGMHTISAFPASDIINAAAVGIISGLAATGANQVKKQLMQ